MRSLLTALIAWLATAAPAQEKPAPDAPPSWPMLSKKQDDRVGVLLKTLRTTKKPESRAAAERELVAMGAGVAPLLLPKLSDYRVNINASLVPVLDAVTTAEHAPLLAEHAQARAAAARGWVLRRLTEFQLPAMAPIFRQARGDRDPDIALQAGLGLAALGDLSAMADIFEHSMKSWDKVSVRVLAALDGARGPAATTWVLETMAKGGLSGQVTGLLLMRAVATADAAPRIAPYLDAEDHKVKQAAVNALRVVVDGDEPMEKMSVFSAIEQARKWKERI